MEYIHKNILIEDYTKYFEKLNNSNEKYSLEFNFCDIDDIKYLKDFNINFNQIKKLNIIKAKKSIKKDGSNSMPFKGETSDKNKDDLKKFDSFFNTLFSFENIEYSLISLTLNIFNESEWNFNASFIQLNPDVLEGLNKLKTLKHLYLYNFIFTGPFTLKLYNLEKLFLKECNNIAFNENSLLKLKSLTLIDSYFLMLEKGSSLLKFPELETLVIRSYYSILSKVFDFSSMTKLKCITSTIEFFLSLENILLEEVHLFIREFEEKPSFILDKNKSIIVIYAIYKIYFII